MIYLIKFTAFKKEKKKVKKKSQLYSFGFPKEQSLMGHLTQMLQKKQKLKHWNPAHTAPYAACTVLTGEMGLNVWPDNSKVLNGVRDMEMLTASGQFSLLAPPRREVLLDWVET